MNCSDTAHAEPKMNHRMVKAISVLRAGGYFRTALETVKISKYMSREQFVTHLYDADRNKVPGVGFKTKLELEKRGALHWRECAPSSVWPTEMVICPIWAKHHP